MYVVGITGGIGSGKTTVSNLFAELGVTVIDADIVAREVVEPGQPAMQQIAKEYGDAVVLPDGHLNRAAMREIVFADPSKRARLEEITHPAIRARMMEQLTTATSDYAIMVLPLLVDTGHWEMIDRVLVVDVDEHTQLERVMNRDHLPEHQVNAILDAQVSREERLAAADDIILNSHDIDHLQKEVAHLHAIYMVEAAQCTDEVPA